MVLFLLAMLAGIALIDRLTRLGQNHFTETAQIMIWRAAGPLLLWLAVLAATGRAGLAAVVCLITALVLVAISRLKRRYLGEPLVFSDFAFLASIARHPDLFYLRPLHVAALGVTALVLLAAAAIWIVVEPASAGPAGRVAAGVLATALAIAFALRPAFLVRAARRLVAHPDLDRDVGRIGLLGSLVVYWLLWRAEMDIAAPAAGQDTLRATPYSAVVIVQAESFVDLRRLGHAELALPAFDRMKARALAHGLLTVPCRGAYTLRPESSVITGTGFAEQGFDGFYPYLRPQRIAARALPQHLAGQGWRTTFIHPHDIRFFRRDRAMPRFGFQKVLGDAAFSGAERFGPYVADVAVARRILQEFQEARAAGQPALIFAATMEAHDPYGPGRLQGEDDAVRQYLRHLANADRMLASLMDAFDADADRVLLVFYGDHVPFLPGFADPFPDARTDYAIAEFGRDASATGAGTELTACEHIHRFVLGRLRMARHETDPHSIGS